jgi:putative serine protease PepD
MSWWTAKRKVAAAGVILAIAVAAGGTGALGAVALVGDHTVLASPTVVAPASAGSSRSNTAQVAAAVQPSVVSISVTTDTGQDTGSGVIIRSDGTILTNAHVVSAAQQGGQVSVKFSDGKTADAKVLGTDPTKDIAVIKATGVSGLKPATLGDSSAVAVGDSVLAVGSPLGLDGSVTSGIVSALNRTIDESSAQPQQPQGGWPFGLGQRQQQQPAASIKDAIQTDAAINPGNSGGALVNSSGQVIGINTAIATTSSGSGSIGVGFAIPMNEAKKVADQILSSGGSVGSSSPSGTAGSGA